MAKCPDRGLLAQGLSLLQPQEEGGEEEEDLVTKPILHAG